jgi:hypothetical protein
MLMSASRGETDGFFQGAGEHFCSKPVRSPWEKSASNVGNAVNRLYEKIASGSDDHKGDAHCLEHYDDAKRVSLLDDTPRPATPEHHALVCGLWLSGLVWTGRSFRVSVTGGCIGDFQNLE